MGIKIGFLEVICGGMFSGKTEEMQRRLRRAEIAKQKYQVFKPTIDTRFKLDKVTTHAGLDMDATPITNPEEIFNLLESDTSVVGIDEAQFFGDSVINVIDDLVGMGKRVVVTVLDMNFRGEPFGCAPILMSKADKLDKLQAICMVCGEPAGYTQRLVNGQPANYNDPTIVVGAAEMYEARCKQHHEVPGKPKK